MDQGKIPSINHAYTDVPVKTSKGDVKDLENHDYTEIPEKAANGDVKENQIENGDLQTTDDNTQVDFKKDFGYRMALTVVLIAISFVTGLYEMWGPVLQDLRDRVNANYEEMSRALTGRAMGIMFAVIIFGSVLEKFSNLKNVIITIGLVFSIVGSLLLPWSTSVLMVGLTMGLVGFGEGSYSVAGHSMPMHLWQQYAAVPLLARQVAVGSGAILAPQIAKNFIKVRNRTQEINSTTCGGLKKSAFDMMSLFADGVNSTDSSNGSEEYRVPYAFMITVSVTVVVFFVMIGFTIYGTPPGMLPTKSKDDKGCHPKECQDGDRLWVCTLLGLFFLYFFFNVGAEQAAFKFMYNYATEWLCMSADEAAALQSVYSLSFLLGPLIASFIATKLAPPYLVPLGLFTSFIPLLCLNLMPSSSTLLWATAPTWCIFFSMLAPSGMSLSNHYIFIDSAGMMVLLLGISTGTAFWAYVTGVFFEENYGSFPTVLLMDSCILLVVYVALQLLASVKGSRFTRNKGMGVAKGEVAQTEEVIRVEGVSFIKLDN